MKTINCDCTFTFGVVSMLSANRGMTIPQWCSTMLAHSPE